MSKSGGLLHTNGFRPRTLRGRISLWYGAIITVCLVAYSILVGVSFAHHVRQELDRRVHEDIELAARAIAIDATGTPHWPGGYLGKQIEEEEGGGHWIEVWNFSGRRLLTAGTFNPALPITVSREEPARTIQTAQGPVRVKTETVHVDAHGFLIRSAVSEAGAREQVISLWLQLAAITVTVLFVGGVGGVALAHRLVGPLARMAEQSRRITAEALHDRLEVEVSGEELEQLRDSFNAALEQLERSFVQLRRFTADASHEIRTPLTALRSVGEVALQGDKPPDAYREVIGTMLEEVDRLSRLSDELLAIARAEGGQAHYDFAPLDVAQLTRHVAEQLEVLAEEREQKLTIDADGPVMAMGDRLTLRQAVMNLIDNAIKYSPEGSVVAVSVTADSEMAVVSVRDRGAGIAPEHADRIFERFYRVDPGRSREMGGTGLGLSLVKLTAEAHGGRVNVESVVGEGSTFRLYVPLVTNG